MDPSYLSWRVKQTIGANFRFAELANDVNDHMPDYVSQRVTMALNRDAKAVNGSRVLVLGLACKRNSGDVRASPVPVPYDRLVALGADVHAANPYVAEEQFPLSVVPAALTRAELRAADLVVVTTDHDAFGWKLVAASAWRVLDTRHRVPTADHVKYL